MCEHKQKPRSRSRAEAARTLETGTFITASSHVHGETRSHDARRSQNSSRRATSPRNSSGKVPSPTPRKSKKTDGKGSSSHTASVTPRVDEGSQSSAAAPSFVASESIAEDEDEHEPEELP